MSRPTLKENERYRYLVERLVPRPRNLQKDTQTTALKDDASSLSKRSLSWKLLPKMQ
jgi:hypothetical protein